MDIREKIKNLSFSAGVYIMKSQTGKVLYVGKASSLKKRVASYFSQRSVSKKLLLLEKVADIECIECASPQQALILEAALIKERKPKYNIALRDNKTYPYIVVTDEEFPCVFISRPKRKSKALFFGPYPEVKTLKSALSLIRKVFPYRSCRVMPKSACLFFQLKLCPAPCEGKISVRDYKVIITSIIRILKGERKRLAKDLEAKMKALAVRKKFEEAARLRDTLLAINNLYEGKPPQHEIISLKELLNLARLPLTIEAIDISYLGDNDAAGSVVVFKDGVPDRNNYRRFRIKEVEDRDDYAMIVEVIRRRYSRLQREEKKLPDLIIVDGGKGQVRRAQKELKTLGISIPIIGLAKRNEEIWFPQQARPLIIPKDSPGLHLIQRLRDEAHRFAHSYQLVRRRKRIAKR